MRINQQTIGNTIQTPIIVIICFIFAFPIICLIKYCWRGWIWTNEVTLVTDYLRIVPICPHRLNANVKSFLLWYSSCVVAGEGFEPPTSRLWALLATSATPHDIYNAKIQIIFEITKFYWIFFLFFFSSKFIYKIDCISSVFVIY